MCVYLEILLIKVKDCVGVVYCLYNVKDLYLIIEIFRQVIAFSPE